MRLVGGGVTTGVKRCLRGGVTGVIVVIVGWLVTLGRVAGSEMMWGVGSTTLGGVAGSAAVVFGTLGSGTGFVGAGVVGTAVSNMAASCRSAAKCGSLNWIGPDGCGFWRACVSSLAASRIVSAGEACGMVYFPGRKEVVPDVRIPLVLGKYER